MTAINGFIVGTICYNVRTSQTTRTGTVERAFGTGRPMNDPTEKVMFRQPPLDCRFLTPRVVFNFLRSAHQGILQIPDLPAHAQSP